MTSELYVITVGRPGAVVGVSWLEAGVKRAAEAWRMQQGVSDEHQIFVRQQ